MESFIHNLVYPQHIQNRGIFRIQGIFRILLKIYHKVFYLKLGNPDIFRTHSIFRILVYCEIKHIQNPAEYLRWSISLRTLCNYSRFKGPIHLKLSLIQDRCVSGTSYCILYILLYQQLFRTTNVLLHPLIKIWATLYLLFFSFTPQYIS